MTAGNNKTISISNHFANTSSRTREKHVQDGSQPFLTFSRLGSHVEYANYICWISNTYYVPFESTLPGRHDERPKHIGLSLNFSPETRSRHRDAFRSSSLLSMDSFYLTLDVHPILHSLRTLACSIDQDRF